MRRLSNLWNWLPVFRVVAETQHLQEAALVLRVAPSSLSRTIRLLERDLGQPLFVRAANRLTLNAAGREFLAVVRNVARLLDDGIVHLASVELSGPLHVMAPQEVSLAFVLPAFRALLGAHPALVPYVRHPCGEDARSLLLRGEIDVLVAYDTADHDQLTVEPLGVLTGGVYCGPSHPLHHVRECTMAEVLQHPFVTIPWDAPVGWPRELERRVGFCVTDLRLAAEVCNEGRLLAVLPDFLPGALDRQVALHRLPVDVVPPTGLYALRRPTLSAPGPAETIIAALRDEVDALRA